MIHEPYAEAAAMWIVPPSSAAHQDCGLPLADVIECLAALGPYLEAAGPSLAKTAAEDLAALNQPAHQGPGDHMSNQLRSWRMPQGIVELGGTIDNAPERIGQTILRLPGEHRPAVQTWLRSPREPTYIRVDTDGTVTLLRVEPAGRTHASLDRIRFHLLDPSAAQPTHPAPGRTPPMTDPDWAKAFDQDWDRIGAHLAQAGRDVHAALAGFTHMLSLQGALASLVHDSPAIAAENLGKIPVERLQQMLPAVQQLAELIELQLHRRTQPDDTPSIDLPPTD